MTTTHARWLVAVFFWWLASSAIWANWRIVIFNWRHRDRGKFISWIPLVGGCLGSLGIWLAPLAELKPFWWAPLLLDFGCFFGFAHTAIAWTCYFLGWHKPRYGERS